MEGAWSQRLKAKCDEALSSVAFNFSLRRYTMVSVMKVDKAPLESYADVGGLEDQIQEIKEAVELPLTHPELYEDIGRGSSRPLFSSTYALFVGYVGYLQ
jgi:ATP-dependent 26S proteasome regulatory subunit